MASISLPPSRSDFSQHFNTTVDSSHRLSMPAPIPNPHFVFPARDSEPHSKSNSNSNSGAQARPALPAFSFNPGSDHSLQPTTHIPSRLNGHRRRHSEFIGGDLLVAPIADDKREEPTTPVLSTSPTAPTGPSPGRGPPRRGHHAHRRSTAVSGVDLLAIQKAIGSAPPTGDRLLDPGHEDISKPLSYSAGSLGRPSPPASPQFAPSSSHIPPVPLVPAIIHIQPPPSSDHDIQIGRPRPPPSPSLSSSSEKPLTPTFAPSSQLESLTPPSNCGLERRKSSLTRPKTADASLALNFLQSQKPSEGLSVKRSKSTGHSRSRKSKSTGNLDTMLAIDDVHSTDNSRVSYSDDGSETWSDNDHEEEEAAKKSRKYKKKQKRVRSWAGAILTRGKGKRHSKPETVPSRAPVLAPAPPALQLTRTNSEVGSVMEVDFDNDDVVVIRTPTNTEAPVSAAERAGDESSPPAPTLENSWKPQSFYEQSAQEYDMLSSPIIDLDAALGPFNTPDMRSIADFPSKFSVATQRMYSGGRRGEFVGPEMRYHRRTESAPAMQPFDRNSLGLTRLCGKSSLEAADVFYEEEEDAFLAANQSPRKVETRPASPTIASTLDDDNMSVDSDDTAETLTRAPVTSEPASDSKPSSLKNEGLGIQSIENATAPIDVPVVGRRSPHLFGRRPRTPLEALKAEELAHGRGLPSPDVSPRCFLAVDKRPSTSPNELTASIPSFSLSAGVSPSDSSFPSPDPRRSLGDRHFLTNSFNDLPSDHPYASVEDVPSLTSSASTMTNTMHRFSSSFLRHARLSTDRAASFSAVRRTSQANTSKRSSLVSLSKLVGSSSERSKLSQEAKPPGDSLERSKKKSHRLSKLMHFWKIKDKEKHSMDAAAPFERPQ
ncbi:hypothetical protein N7495_002434 [Penicillium taxi]|uniref:uncharacterized protein n=1 Tax=Penicillium taxi TaxID=168475 RepID=UPI0025458CCE|nr:uncharacterized protein N7495_002434 [Penicillium taxi]KAJ5901906.1 hypothetical protein N7495_002434 [Penicillium taxi]